MDEDEEIRKEENQLAMRCDVPVLGDGGGAVGRGKDCMYVADGDGKRGGRPDTLRHNKRAAFSQKKNDRSHSETKKRKGLSAALNCTSNR